MGLRFCPGCSELSEASHQACPHCAQSFDGIPVIEVLTASEVRGRGSGRALTQAMPVRSSPSPRDSSAIAVPAVLETHSTLAATGRRRNRVTRFVAVGGALALAGALIGWALTERSSAAKSRSDSRSWELRASDLSHQLGATTGHLRQSQAAVARLNHRIASLASQKARIAVERQRLRRIVVGAAKIRKSDATRRGQFLVAGGCLDSSSDFADARVIGAPNTLNNVDFYSSIDGTCTGGVRPGGDQTMVISGTEADAVGICNARGATNDHARFASFGYPVPSAWWLCV